VGSQLSLLRAKDWEEELKLSMLNVELLPGKQVDAFSPSTAFLVSFNSIPKAVYWRFIWKAAPTAAPAPANKPTLIP
jgi:hypothetical protein